MHIASLPFELISEIVNHLRPDPYEVQEVKEAAEDGRSLSLVCRQWLPIGQALCWRTIIIDDTAVRVLSDHFTSFPYLALLVRYLTEYRKAEDNQITGSDWADRFPTLLSLTRNVRDVLIDGHLGTNFLPLLRTASSLPFLHKLDFLLDGSISWTREEEAIWEEGFQSLEFFTISIDRVDTSQPAPLVSRPPAHVLKQLRYISMWIDYSQEGDKLFRSLLSRVDATTLRVWDVGDHAFNQNFISWTRDCARMERLDIEVDEELVHEAFDRLVTYLPDIKAEEIKFKCINWSNPSEGVGVVLPLSRVLSSIPPRLRWFDARELVFLDQQGVSLGNSSEQEEEDRESGYVSVRALDQTPEGYRPVTYRKKLDGKNQWVKVLEKEESWAEWDRNNPEEQE